MSDSTRPLGLHAEWALLPQGWARDVTMRWDAAGGLTEVLPGSAPDAALPRAMGPVIPGMPNLHSHAFQRGFAGLSEYRGESRDSFWSWRELMYRFALRISPEQLEAIAFGLYVEMIEAGYTSVCEFHYLHHDAEGRAYADPTEMSQALLRAAARAGIGLTLLPVLYQTSGFGGTPPTPMQRRFVHDSPRMLQLLERLGSLCDAQGARLGLAPHSLRAVPPESLTAALEGLRSLDASAPVHIHIAEQTAEVDACLAWSGQRPVAWLLDHAPVDRHWCLVHATHMDAAEYRAAAASGAVAGLCPTTEANLGDGIFDFPAWREAGGAWGIGSDSHVCVDAAEDLMLLEYSQRLQRRERNVGATGGTADVAQALWQQAVAGGAQASGRAVAGLRPGQQADFIVLDAAHPVLAGLPPSSMLAMHVFASSRRRAIDQVWVAGQRRVSEGRHALADAAAAAFASTRAALLEG